MKAKASPTKDNLTLSTAFKNLERALPKSLGIVNVLKAIDAGLLGEEVVQLAARTHGTAVAGALKGVISLWREERHQPPLDQRYRSLILREPAKKSGRPNELARKRCGPVEDVTGYKRIQLDTQKRLSPRAKTALSLAGFVPETSNRMVLKSGDDNGYQLAREAAEDVLFRDRPKIVREDRWFSVEETLTPKPFDVSKYNRLCAIASTDGAGPTYNSAVDGQARNLPLRLEKRPLDPDDRPRSAVQLTIGGDCDPRLLELLTSMGLQAQATPASLENGARDIRLSVQGRTWYDASGGERAIAYLLETIGGFSNGSITQKRVTDHTSYNGAPRPDDVVMDGLTLSSSMARSACGSGHRLFEFGYGWSESVRVAAK